MQDKRPFNEQGQRHGYWEVYFNDGTLAYKGTFINGKRYGFWYGFDIFGLDIPLKFTYNYYAS